jgi:ABC-type Fe3+/spermidine/putrescine transport system ATPase subunit
LTEIRFRGLERTFGTVHAVRGITADIRDGEFFTLLGPSGCGKTTLLRMVAGFCELDRGSIHFGERRVDTLPPHRRNTGMVFQNYAIFPNLTVGGNVAYGLKVRGVTGKEAALRVGRALKLVQLAGYEERWPHQLSGGQLQRVAIARCLVIEPEVLLLDEPLSNLDARLRVEMRTEIRQLQQTLGITALYVTHDQEEALAVSDRIAVMQGGRIEQIGTPAQIYHQPATPFVAEFVGTTNLLSGSVTGRTGKWMEVDVGGQTFRMSGNSGAGAKVSFSLRPEAARLVASDAAAPNGWPVLQARLSRLEFLGALTRAELLLAGGQTLRIAAIELPPGIETGERSISVTYDPAQVTAFEAS